jgi:hypothetical protein
MSVPLLRDLLFLPGKPGLEIRFSAMTASPTFASSAVFGGDAEAEYGLDKA